MIAASLLPLTSLQRSMVLASLAEPHHGVYFLQDVCILNRDVDLDVLRSAWNAVTARHPVLRCAISVRDGEPLGLELCDRAAAWMQVDHRHLTAAEHETRLEDHLREDRERGFDLEAGPPQRIAAFRTAGPGVTLVWSIHHALLDGRSMTLVWQEWLASYEALVVGCSLPLAEPDRFPELAPAIGSDAERFWREYLHGVSRTGGYIVERIRPEGSAGAGIMVRERATLSLFLTARLRELAGSHGVTLNTLVQAAWALLLSRYGGGTDIVYGVARSGRSPEMADKVGFFLNTLPLRVEVNPSVTLGPWLCEIRSRWLSLRQVEHTPLHQAAVWGGLPPGAAPFDSLLNYEHKEPAEALRKLGIRHRRLQRTDSPLTLAVHGSPVLTLELIFDSGLFSPQTMAAAAGHLRQLLERFVSTPDARLHELDMLAPAERALLVKAPETMPRPDRCAHQIFEQWVETSPANTALDTGAACLSYAELNGRANALARQLRSAGVDAGDIVGVCIAPSPEAVIAVLGILKSGAAFLPIEPDQPEERLQSILDDARPKLVLCRDPLPAGAATARERFLTVPDWRVEAATSENPAPAATLDDLAYIIYTSGSSGQPKAVAMTHRGLANHSLAASSAYGISQTDRRLQMAAIGTDVFIAEVFNYLCRGAALVFGWDRSNRSIRAFLRFLEERRVTITGMPSAWWREWMAAAEQSGGSIPAGLRAVIIGMEKADPAAFVNWGKQTANTVRLFNAYGPTEASPTSTIYEAGTSPWETESYVPIGKPIPNTTVCVLDGDGLLVPVGVAGELYIGGPGLARGYWNRPELTAERFVPCPLDPAERVYRTGDIVFVLPDGNLVFVGRADRQVKIRGFRVELDEVETVLAGHHEVKQCAVVLAGEGEHACLGAFVAFRGDAVSSADLRAFLARHLPEPMIPRVFVVLPALPLTPAGKIDRQSLPLAQLEQQRRGDVETLSTPTERRLAEIWREILNVWPIGAADDFFALGAGSLDATRLITFIDQRFGVEVPPALLLRVPTLARMAFVLDQREMPKHAGDDEGYAVALNPGGSRVPFFCLPGNDSPGFFLPLAANLGDERPFYAVRDPRPYTQREPYTVPQAAARMTEAIRQVQPHGPYLLGGHCFGGLVAFEVARLLVQQGETVARVILFDVAAPGYPKVLRNWSNYLRAAAKWMRGKRPVTFSEIRRHLRWLSSLPSQRADGQPQTSLHPNARAGSLYCPQPLDCELVQIIAAGEHHTTEILDDPRLGWKDLALRSFTVREVQGKAEELYRPPRVKDLAACIAALLDEAAD